MTLNRRELLTYSATIGAGALFIGGTDSLLLAPGAVAAPPGGYGPLLPDPAGRLALPEGFHYEIVSEAGVTTLDSGEFTPGKHDGTGCFTNPGSATLVHNHEIGDAYDLSKLHVPHTNADLVYDPSVGGGCTVLTLDQHGKRLSERVGVAGTHTNCAGGVTPWDTWLTCEETEQKAGRGPSIKDHGYVFEVDPGDPQANLHPTPIKCLGRFAHEAVAVDPRTSEIYLTEDASGPTGLLYRWSPPAGFPGRKGALKALEPSAGELCAMLCRDGSGAKIDDVSRAIRVGTIYEVEWVPVPDRDAGSTSIRKQFANDQITRGRKFEGAWWGDGGAYIVTSFARAESPVQHDGQVWFFDPQRQTITLKVRYGVNATPAVDGAFDGPDNIATSPHGGLILAEDGEGVQHLIGVTDGGLSYPLARNDIDDNEFAGPCFTHNKKVLFANLQTPGIAFAITGPWRRF